MGHILEMIHRLGEETNCDITLSFYSADPRHNIKIVDRATNEGNACEVDWLWPEHKILETIVDTIKEMKERPKCFNCKHYHPDPGFFEICGCDCNNFSKYEDKNKVVTLIEF